MVVQSTLIILINLRGKALAEVFLITHSALRRCHRLLRLNYKGTGWCLITLMGVRMSLKGTFWRDIPSFRHFYPLSCMLLN